MPINIQPYREEHRKAVQEFNQRLRSATSDANLVFYERATPSWLPEMEGSPLVNQFFLALEDEMVRGAYALKYERFFLAGRGEYTVACYHHPLSEGIINRSYSSVGSLLLRDALRREPLLYALGMGGLNRPLPAMLKLMKWNLLLVPFYFRIVHAYRFLRHMEALRQSCWRRWLMDLAAFSGIGWAAVRGLRTVHRLRAGNPGVPAESQEIDEFPAWADTLWLEAKDAYSLTSVRDRPTLNRLYPADNKHLTKLCVSERGQAIGWAVVGQRRKDRKYGCLRVGSIVDCWAHPENAPQVVRAAREKLEEKGMDLIVSNQSHPKWCQALSRQGFFQAPSNFVFATSKKHSEWLQSAAVSGFHLTRANGDGLPRNY